MKTIKERAKEFAENFFIKIGISLYEAAENVDDMSYAYEQGAEKQKQIDIKKTIEFAKREYKAWWSDSVEQKFLKMMEE